MSILQNIDNEFFSAHNIRQFRHKAMNTMFELYIAGEEDNYASQAAHEVFKEIDIIENDLSKFIPGSDISKINNSPVNTAVVVGEHAFEALSDCRQLYEITSGSFNVTIGKLIDKWKEGVIHENNEEDDDISHNQFPLIINDTDFSIIKISGISIDLGGYGKGYGLDKAAEMLKEWSVGSFLISGGYSTVLTYDSGESIKGWPVSISDPSGKSDPKILSIRNTSLSSSGMEKGRHIIDPKSQNAAPRKAVWTACHSAAWSDAFATALMILDIDEVSKICNEYKIDALLMEENGEGIRMNTFGDTFRSR